MTDSTAPRWFTIAAIAALLFELVGMAGFVVDIMTSPAQIAAMPPGDQLARAATPGWIYAAYGMAVSTGLAGAIALLLRRRASVALLALSLLAILVQFGGMQLLPGLARLLPPGTATVGLIVLTLGALVFALAWTAHRRGWLR